MIYVVEADRQNEPLRRNGYGGSDYASKFKKYKALIGGGHYKAHLGTQAGMVVLHVTTNERHMHNLMELGGKSPYHLYKTLSTLGDFQRAPKPTPELLSVPWRRNGYPDYSIEK